MWQFVTIEAGQRKDLPTRASAAAGGAVTRLRNVGLVTHGLTHRRYEFAVYHGAVDRSVDGTNGSPRAWVTLGELDRFPLPRPHLKVAAMIAEANR
jgi:adenine-specific DNA glycosylase